LKKKECSYIGSGEFFFFFLLTLCFLDVAWRSSGRETSDG
jgi:hypothetical protein